MLFTSSLLVDSLILLTAFIYILIYFTSRNYTYWKKRGVYAPETRPFVGNFLDVVLLKKTAAEWIKDVYDKIDKDFFGVYIFDDPYFVAKNPQLIKNILIKDFAHFVDRNAAAPKHSPYTSQITFFQKSPAWKTGRNKLSAAFTSGKLKSMFHIITQTSEELVSFIKKSESIMEAKEIAARYSTDIISKTAYGIKAHSFEKNDSSFTFQRKMIFAFTLRNAFAQLLYFFKPSWVDKLKLEFIPKNTLEYFVEAFQKSSQMRKIESNKVNKDLIDIINDLKLSKEIESDGSDDHLCCGAALQFFLAGFETTSATISFTLYEFAMNLDIQNSVRDEIKLVVDKYKCFTYEGLQEMEYLDMCVQETLRRYPVLPFIERKCNKDYLIPDHDIVIEKNTPVLIPMLGLHLDADFFPDPLTYNPERFRSKLDNSKGLVYMPFGHGPRNCMGERFGALMTKMALANIIYNFEVVPCSKTPVPIVFEPKSFLLQSNVGLPLEFRKINK